jgi:GH43 family beta-xylosidase
MRLLNRLNLLILLTASVACRNGSAPATSTAEKTFTNPLLPAGADPWSVYHDGFYYYTHTTGRNLTLWKTRSLADLKTAESKVVWTPPATGPYSKEIWAPELHRLDGKWYLYFAADDGRNDNHRLYVLENTAADPLTGTWNFLGKVQEPADKWAIDGSVFEHGGQRYLVWSGWEDDVNGRQDLFIAPMRTPTTLGSRVKISTPTYAWERVGDLNDPNNPPHVDVNEGPQVLTRGTDVFLVYSASGCWTESYALGLLRASASADLLDPKSWTKSPEPVFRAAPTDSVFAPGHNSFFKSPDGTEDWILYHANDQPGQGCGRFRSPRAQRFTWNADGTPRFGTPIRRGQPVPIPAE